MGAPCADSRLGFLGRLRDACGSGALPLLGQWELTCRCNLNCVMCYTDPFNTPGRIRRELATPEILRILGELRDAGCLELCLTGGEPLARPDFIGIYTRAKELGFLLTLFTNGTLITPKVADHLKRYTPRMIEISFHGMTRASFDGITQGPGSYDRCREGIRLLLERGLPLTIKTLGMTVNRDEVREIKAWAGGLAGVQYQFGSVLRPRLDGATDADRIQLPVEEVRRIERADAQFRAERRLQDRRYRRSLRRDGVRCGGGRFRFHIDAYGQLSLCSENRRQGYDLRSGSFREGFFAALPGFPCPNRCPAAPTDAERDTHAAQALAARPQTVPGGPP
ncbi:MAG: radical SAM protein [Planctomycetes bacterium]|nr:radical SAM protein [Planctomycetota bacterium]